ncbi:MAG: hypothetical protein IV100_25050 [Myxococcales bacterium]|nr:hypothetical protein [Myxococcales bacterium]
MHCPDQSLDGAASDGVGLDVGFNVVDAIGGGYDVSDVDFTGMPCDDQNGCTLNDRTVPAGGCTGDMNICDDGESCTQDHCWAKVGCTHVWTPGCGGKPCGECPADLGFECVSDLDGFACLNEATSEVFVAAGMFWFGWNSKVLTSSTGISDDMLDYLASSYEVYYASNPVFVDSFAIGMTKVTLEEFEAALTAGALGPTGSACEDYLSQETNDSESVSANAYFYCFDSVCKLQGKRLCTEFEWEKAANGGAAILGVAEGDWEELRMESNLWPWGNLIGTCEQLSLCGGCSIDEASPCDLEVLQHPGGASLYGAHDMISRKPEHVLSLITSGWFNDQKNQYDALAGTDLVISGLYSYGGYWTPDAEGFGLMTTKGYIKLPSFEFSRQDYMDVATARCCRSMGEF